jgi:hypothetical protein
LRSARVVLIPVAVGKAPDRNECQTGPMARSVEIASRPLRVQRPAAGRLFKSAFPALNCATGTDRQTKSPALHNAGLRCNRDHERWG